MLRLRSLLTRRKYDYYYYNIILYYIIIEEWLQRRCQNERGCRRCCLRQCLLVINHIMCSILWIQWRNKRESKYVNTQKSWSMVKTQKIYGVPLLRVPLWRLHSPESQYWFVRHLRHFPYKTCLYQGSKLISSAARKCLKCLTIQYLPPERVRQRMLRSPITVLVFLTLKKPIVPILSGCQS